MLVSCSGKCHTLSNVLCHLLISLYLLRHKLQNLINSIFGHTDHAIQVSKYYIAGMDGHVESRILKLNWNIDLEMPLACGHSELSNYHMYIPRWAEQPRRNLECPHCERRPNRPR